MSSQASKPEVRPGVYEHYKGKRYLVITTAILESDLSPHVVYVPLYEDDQRLGRTWLRRLDDFTSDVEVDGKTQPRFRYIGQA